MALNLAVALQESARLYPAKTAVILGDQRMTYAELGAAANQVCNALRSLGIHRGDKVAMMLPNVPQFPVIYYGILKLGATVLPLNVLFRANEVQYHLEDSDAVAFFVWEGLAEEAKRGFDKVETCRHFVVVNSPGAITCPMEPSPTMPCRPWPLVTATHLDHARRHRGVAVYRRHHRASQGRRAYPFQHVPQCQFLCRPAGWADRRRCGAGLPAPCFTPLAKRA